MDGVDKAWLTAPRNGFARYASLPPGDYSFMVRNFGDSNGSRHRRIAIHIGTPFWRQWWFIVACAAAVFFIGFSIYRYRIQQLISLQKVRNRIATDLHDDIGSTLTNINILAELSSVNINNTPKAATFIQRISEEVGTTAQSLDDIVWSINTGNDSLSQMAARMRRYASDLFEHADITWQLLFDENIGTRKLTMDQRRDIYLIFKEAVNNIYKHAQATHVQVTLQLQKGQVVLEINDNGRGFDQSLPTDGNGVKNMHTRTKKWRGRCTVTSNTGGTAIKITMPLFSSSPK
jgi:signal transduction histidine kinase